MPLRVWNIAYLKKEDYKTTVKSFTSWIVQMSKLTECHLEVHTLRKLLHNHCTYQVQGFSHMWSCLGWDVGHHTSQPSSAVEQCHQRCRHHQKKDFLPPETYSRRPLLPLDLFSPTSLLTLCKRHVPIREKSVYSSQLLIQ